MEKWKKHIWNRWRYRQYSWMLQWNRAHEPKYNKNKNKNEETNNNHINDIRAIAYAVVAVFLVRMCELSHLLCYEPERITFHPLYAWIRLNMSMQYDYRNNPNGAIFQHWAVVVVVEPILLPLSFCRKKTIFSTRIGFRSFVLFFFFFFHRHLCTWYFSSFVACAIFHIHFLPNADIDPI